jgi:hypothetical protein
MVHEPNEPEADCGKFRPNRLPYAADRTTVYERDGRSATDKTQRLPESRKPGFGVRNENNSGKVKKTPQPERAKNATRGEARSDQM